MQTSAASAVLLHSAFSTALVKVPFYSSFYLGNYPIKLIHPGSSLTALLYSCRQRRTISS